MSKINIVYTDQDQQRIDVYLTKVLAEQADTDSYNTEISRSQIKDLIQQGLVKVNQKPVLKSSFKLKEADNIELHLAPKNLQLASYDFPLKIVYQDDHLAVIEKPAGLTMHPGAGNKNQTLVNALCSLKIYSNDLMNSNNRPGIVHRLDKDTSGLVVVAKNSAAHANLATQFKDRTVGRKYYALAYNSPRGVRYIQKSDSGIIDLAIGRNPNKSKQMQVKEDGKKAITNWEVVERYKYASLLDVKLETGRTHQIRVHLAHLGSPLIGDPVYFNNVTMPKFLENVAHTFKRQALHAYHLAFDHPKTGERISFTQELPEDFQKLKQAFRDFND